MLQAVHSGAHLMAGSSAEEPLIPLDFARRPKLPNQRQAMTEMDPWVVHWREMKWTEEVEVAHTSTCYRWECFQGSLGLGTSIQAPHPQR